MVLLEAGTSSRRKTRSHQIINATVMLGAGFELPGQLIMMATSWQGRLGDRSRVD
jgi:hypothetical protein